MAQPNRPPWRMFWSAWCSGVSIVPAHIALAAPSIGENHHGGASEQLMEIVVEVVGQRRRSPRVYSEDSPQVSAPAPARTACREFVIARLALLFESQGSLFSSTNNPLASAMTKQRKKKPRAHLENSLRRSAETSVQNYVWYERGYCGRGIRMIDEQRRLFNSVAFSPFHGM